MIPQKMVLIITILRLMLQNCHLFRVYFCKYLLFDVVVVRFLSQNINLLLQNIYLLSQNANLLSWSGSFLSWNANLLSLNNDYLSCDGSFLSWSSSFLSWNANLLSWSGSFLSLNNNYLSCDGSFLSWSGSFLSLNNNYLSCDGSFLSLNSLSATTNAKQHHQREQIRRSETFIATTNKTKFNTNPEKVKWFRKKWFWLSRYCILCYKLVIFSGFIFWNTYFYAM